jgi:hypothetical protein
MQGLFDNVAARIRANCTAILQTEVAPDAVAAVEMMTLAADVTALVCDISDSAVPVRSASLMVSQEETTLFGVLLALVFPGGFPEYEAARDQVKATIRGWRPPGASKPCEYAGGRTLQYELGADGGRWLRLLQFRVTEQAFYEHQQ